MDSWNTARGRLLLIVAGVILLTLAAEKSRQLVGEDVSSKSGKFSWVNCFDMRSGSLACITKEGVKFYVNNIRAGHVERARHRAYEIAYGSAMAEGLDTKAAAKKAQNAGKKEEKLVSRQTRRITGPIMAAGWDAFEALYYGGTLLEAILRGTGTICGTYLGGLQGETKIGRIGYLIGSHLGSWFGGRVGLMVYDIFEGIRVLTSDFVGPTNYIETEATDYEL